MGQKSIISISRRQFVQTLAPAGLALVLLPSGTKAQGQFPSKNLKLIVPYAAGGGTDAIARLIAQAVGTVLGQTMIVENRAGAGGNVGTEAVFRAPPDGYTMLFTAQPPLVANKSLYSKLTFDPEQMTPVSVMATGYSVLLVNPKLPVNNLQEFVAFGRANPGKLNYASQGIGNAAHLTAELFSSMAGIKMVHIPYKGTGPALADLLSGQVEVLFGELATAGVHVRAGNLKILGVGGATRHPDYPQVPAIAEVMPQFQALIWQGMVGPPGLSPAIARKWADLITEVVKQPDVVKRLGDLSMIPTGGTPDEMARFMREDAQRWNAVVKASGAKAD